MIQLDAPNLIMLFVTLVVGFVAGHLYSGQRKQKRQDLQGHGYSHSRGGKKRRARIRKSENKREAKAADLKKSPLSSSVQGNPNELSRRTCKRSKNLSSKDLALDAFVRVARAHVECIGAVNYESLFLLPKAVFIAAGRFLPYMECRELLVTLGQARTAMTGVDELRVLYVSCSWWGTNSDKTDWDAKDFETTRAFLEHNPEVMFVYVGRSCMVNDFHHPLNDTQLWHVPCVLLRADYMLILPSPSTEPADGTDPSTSKWQPHSDFRSYTREAWARMELSLAAIGQAKVHVAFRTGAYPESVCEFETRRTGCIRDMVNNAVDALRAAAASSGAGITNAMEDNGIDGATKVGTVGNGRERGSNTLTTAVRMACDNWFDSDVNPLKALEEARAFVTAAEKDDKINVLEILKSMPTKTPSEDPIAGVRTALGEEYRKGSRQLALYFLVVSVLCTKPKERGTYTDAFVDTAAEMDITYRPIALVRSPYRERFGTPRQPQVTASVLHGGAQEGQIVFLKGQGFGECACRTNHNGFFSTSTLIIMIDDSNIAPAWLGPTNSIVSMPIAIVALSSPELFSVLRKKMLDFF